jgi:hypothetical protein
MTVKRGRYTMAEARWVAHGEDRRRTWARKIDPKWDGVYPEGSSLRALAELHEAVSLLGCAIIESPPGAWIVRQMRRAAQAR